MLFLTMLAIDALPLADMWVPCSTWSTMGAFTRITDRHRNRKIVRVIALEMSKASFDISNDGCGKDPDDLSISVKEEPVISFSKPDKT